MHDNKGRLQTRCLAENMVQGLWSAFRLVCIARTMCCVDANKPGVPKCCYCYDKLDTAKLSSYQKHKDQCACNPGVRSTDLTFEFGAGGLDSAPECE